MARVHFKIKYDTNVFLMLRMTRPHHPPTALGVMAVLNDSRTGVRTTASSMLSKARLPSPESDQRKAKRVGGGVGKFPRRCQLQTTGPNRPKEKFRGNNNDSTGWSIFPWRLTKPGHPCHPNGLWREATLFFHIILGGSFLVR